MTKILRDYLDDLLKYAKIIHEYSRVDLTMLWNTSLEKIPELIYKLETILNQQNE